MPGLLRDTKVASASVAVVTAGHLTFAADYGEQAPGIKASRTTLYKIASLLKPLTAEIILRLASAGQLSLDGPMARY